VTNLVQWREKNKNKFKEKYGENLTFTPLFIDAVVRALKDFPMVNISLDGNRILVKKRYQHRYGSCIAQWQSYSSGSQKCGFAESVRAGQKKSMILPSGREKTG
jgi:hypothetical protein